VRPTLVLATAAALAVGVLGVGPARADQPPTDPSTARAKPPKVYSMSLGQVGAGACNVGTPPAAVVIDTEGAGAATYVAPQSGVITRFAHRANGVSGQVRAIVFADGATATQKTVAAVSAKMTVTPNSLNIFEVRLPIKAGQRVGLGFTANGMACAVPAGVVGDATMVKAPFDPDTSTSFVAGGVLSAPGTTFRPNISAVLESDVDGDGYGDISQDGCAQSGKVTAVCPDTTITKKPRHKSARKKVKVKIKFTASIAGSTFQCRLDGHKKWKACASPYKKRLGVGRHSLQVRAVSPAGIPDPKPAKAKFTIRRA
jgi:hypothetical protein